MLERSEIAARLRAMREQENPALRWDQQCEGSARALAVFVGPSPGSSPHDPKQRRPRKRHCRAALWNESYTDPLTWAGGFRIGFKPLVEAIFAAPYARASKLIARANLDWHGNSNAADVPERFMVEGASSVLQLIADCSPELVLPMEKRAFGILRRVMQNNGFGISELDVKHFQVRIRDAAEVPRHRTLHGFRAESPEGRKLLVIKLPQHPVKILQVGYGTRMGAAIRLAARQIAAGQPVDVPVDSDADVGLTPELIERFRKNLDELVSALGISDRGPAASNVATPPSGPGSGPNAPAGGNQRARRRPTRPAVAGRGQPPDVS